MAAKLILNNTDEIEATLVYTMTIGDWKMLLKDLPNKYPSGQFHANIKELIYSLTKQVELDPFHNKDEQRGLKDNNYGNADSQV